MQHREVGGRPRAAGAAVDAAGLQRGAGPHRAIGVTVAEHHIGDFVEAGDFRMRNLHLILQQRLDLDPGLGQRAGIVRNDGKADLLHVDQRIEHAAEGDVGANLAPFRRLHPGVDLQHEGRHIVQAHRQAAAILATRPRGDEAGRRVELHRRLRFHHLHPPGLEQCCHDADAIGARHGMRLVGLQHDEGRIGIGPRGFQSQVHRHRHMGARFEGDEAAKRAIHIVDVVHLVEDGGAGDLRRTADDHLADLALAVHQQEFEAVLPHGVRTPRNGRRDRASCRWVASPP